MIRENNIPKHWGRTKASEVGKLLRGVNYKKEEASSEPKKDYLPVLRGNNINGELNFDDLVYVQIKNINQEQHIKSGDIVFAMSSGSKHLVGKSAKAKTNFNGSFGAFCGVFRPSENFNKDFVAYFFQSPYYKKVISEISKGTNINNLKREHILDLDFPIPPIHEQQAIVAKIEELLSELENGKQQLQTAQQQLKVYRRSLLNLLVTGKNLKTIDSVIIKLDQGWSPRCLNENSTNDTEWAVIKTSAIQYGHFVSFENKILPRDLKPREQHELNVGDILITRAGPRVRVGVCCMVRKTRPRLINCDKVYRIKVNTKIISPEYFELILNTPFYQREIEKMKSGISDSGLNLTQSKFLKIEIPIPSIKEQQHIAEELESKLTVCDKIEETISQSLQQVETLRQSILKKAFEGELVKL